MEKIRLLLYCTKGTLLQWHFKKFLEKPYMTYGRKVKEEDYESPHTLNGKVIAECDFEVDTIVMQKGADDKIYGNNGFMGYGIISKNHSFSWYDENKTCLSEEKLFKYLKGKNGYAIHIKNLNIFDEPRELSDYCLYPKNIKGVIHFVLEGTPYIVLSVSPQEMCRLLNGEQTILVRKKVLKEMVK